MIGCDDLGDAGLETKVETGIGPKRPAGDLPAMHGELGRGGLPACQLTRAEASQ